MTNNAEYVYSADELRERLRERIEQGDKPQDDAKIDEVANKILSAVVGVVLIGEILGKDADKEKPDKGKPVVNMCSKAMKKSELKEMKRQARMIKRRYG